MSTVQSWIKFICIKLAIKSSRGDSPSYTVDMHSTSTSDSCPLLNEYKQKFLQSRLPQTFFGGVRFRNVPREVIFSQILLLTLPVYLGAISVILHQYLELPVLILNGCIGLLLTMMFTIVNFIPRPKKSVKCSQKQGFSLEEENQITIETFISWDHFEFLFPANKMLTYKLLDPLLYGIIYCIGAEVFKLEYLVLQLGLNQSTFVVLFILSWVSLCTGMFGLVSNPGTEIAVFRSHDNIGISHLYRPFYLVLVTGVILGSYLADKTKDGLLVTNGTHVVEEKNIIISFYILLSLLFIIFLIGLLPPIDCLYSYTLEFILVHFGGYSAAADDFRLLREVVVVTISVVTSHFIPNNLVFVSVVAATLSNSISLLHPEVYKNYKALCLLVTSIIPGALISTLVTFYFKPKGFGESLAMVEIMLIILLAINIVIVEIRRVYVIFGIVRNPVYRAFRNSRPILLFIRTVRGISSVLVSPSVLCYYYCTLLFSSHNTLPWYYTVLLFAVVRSIWQNTTVSMTQAVLFVFVRVNHTTFHLTSDQLTKHTLLVIFVCGFVARSFPKLIEKLMFCIKLQLDFILLKKQRRTSTLKITLLNVVCLPLIVAVIVFSTVTGIQLLPLFSLPLFYLSFPRPERFWPTPTTPNYSKSHDSSYYKQVCRHVVAALQRATLSTPPAGTFILSRVENLLLVTRVMESGFGAFNCVVKGLELQETSCHTEEVNVVNDVFDEAFSSQSVSVFNGYYFHTLQPLTQEYVTTYSDARNVLTGILDSPDCLHKIRQNFRKSFVYLLCHVDISQGEVRYAAGIPGVSSPRGGFDFSGFKHTAQPMSPVETETRSSGFVNKHRKHKQKESDFLDGLSFGSDDSPTDSWHHATEDVVENIFVNRSVAKDSNLNMTSTTSTSDDVITSQLPNTSASETNIRITNSENTPIDNNIGYKNSIPADEDWQQLPYTKTCIDKISDSFPDQFYQCLKKYVPDRSEAYDKIKAISLATYQIVHEHLEQRDKKLTPNQVVKNYNGNFEWSSELPWLQNNKTLHQLATAAYRFAVKLSVDELVYGAAEDEDEIVENIRELEDNWYIGNEKDDEWSENVEKETQFLFSLGFNEEGLYCSRTLTLTNLLLNIGTLNTECVKSFWSSLAFELLYLTNDDEERYSIQAHPNLLRNIAIQAADLPLGYPLYLSPLTHALCI